MEIKNVNTYESHVIVILMCSQIASERHGNSEFNVFNVFNLTEHKTNLERLLSTEFVLQFWPVIAAWR